MSQVSSGVAIRKVMEIPKVSKRVKTGSHFATNLLRPAIVSCISAEG